MRRQAFFLVGLGVVVLGLVIALLVSMRSADETTPPAAPAPPGPPARGAPTATADVPTLVRSALPRVDGGAAAGEPGGDAAPVRDWRDHRSGPPGEGRTEPIVGRETLQTIRPDLHAIVKRCAEPLKAQSPPPQGRVVITMHVKVAGGKVQIPNVMIRQDKVSSQDKTADDALVRCVRQGFENASLTAAAGQADGEEDVSMAFPFP